MGYLRGVDILVNISSFSPREITFMTSCLLSFTSIPFWKWSSLKERNLLPGGANSFLLEQTPFQKGAKCIELSSLKKCQFPLKVPAGCHWMPTYIMHSRKSFRLWTLMKIWRHIHYFVHVIDSSRIIRRNVRKRTFGHVRPSKIQISLRIRAFWSESSLGAFWIANNAKFLHADNEGTNQTAQANEVEFSLGAYVRAYVFSHFGSNIDNLPFWENQWTTNCWRFLIYLFFIFLFIFLFFYFFFFFFFFFLVIENRVLRFIPFAS